MKKIVSLVLAMCLVIAALTACGGGGSPAPATTAAPEAVTEAAAEVTEAAAEVTEAAEAAAPAGDEESYVWKFSFGQPLESMDGQGYQYFAEVLKEESGGTLQLELYPASTLVGNDEMLDALMDGTADIGHVSIGYMSPTIKELTPLELPGMYRGDRYNDFAWILREKVDEICQPYGVKIAAVLPPGVMNVASTKGIVHGPDDFQGLNVRVGGKWIGEGISTWGATPATITLADVPTALERKTVDAVYAGANQVIRSFKLYELAHYITFTQFQEQCGFMGMNLDSYNKLSDNQKLALERAVQRWAMHSEELMMNGIEDFRGELEANGNEVYDLTDEENQVLMDLSLALIPQALEVGGEGAQVLVDTCEQIRAGYDKEYQMGVIPDEYKIID